jgi:hypothetical protein
MHVIKKRSPLIMGNQRCSYVIKENNTLLYLAQVSIINIFTKSQCNNLMLWFVYEIMR